MATESFWCDEAAQMHADPEQIARQERARTVHLDTNLVDIATKSAAISDYAVSLDTCTCRDCALRRLPCKHMYRLAHELGAFDLGAMDLTRSQEVPKRLPSNELANTYRSGFETCFAWAVPSAFVRALASCRFELGDVIYDTMHGYDPWHVALKHLKYHIEVKYPVRSSSKTVQAEPDADSVFRSNWGKTAEIYLKDYAADNTERIFTTQGRIYTCLATGDIGWLDTRHSAPRPPLLASDVMRCLKCIDLQEAAEIAFDKLPVVAGLGKEVVVWLPHDLTNLVLCTKYRRLHMALSDRFSVRARLIQLPRDPVNGSSWYAPTVAVAELRVHTPDVAAVNAVCKAILFQAAADKSGSFSMRRHGYIHGYKPSERVPAGNPSREKIVAWLGKEKRRKDQAQG